MSLASRRWGRAEGRGQILDDGPLFVKALQAVGRVARSVASRRSTELPSWGRIEERRLAGSPTAESRQGVLTG